MLKKSIFVATILAASINFAHAEDVVPDKFKIALGGYSVFRYDSTISTIGCGVLVPTTTWSKLFTIIFSILSIGFFVAVIAKIVTIVL